MEALVASVLFLGVFCICLETLAHLAVTDSGPAIQAALDNAVSLCEKRCLEEPQQPGTTHEEFPWGELTLRVSPYGEEPDLQEIVITARAERTRKRLELRRIVYHPQNTPADEMR